MRLEQRIAPGTNARIPRVVSKSDSDHGTATTTAHRTLGLTPTGTICRSNLSLSHYPLRIRAPLRVQKLHIYSILPCIFLAFNGFLCIFYMDFNSICSQFHNFMIYKIGSGPGRRVPKLPELPWHGHELIHWTAMLIN